MINKYAIHLGKNLETFLLSYYYYYLYYCYYYHNNIIISILQKSVNALLAVRRMSLSPLFAAKRRSSMDPSILKSASESEEEHVVDRKVSEPIDPAGLSIPNRRHGETRSSCFDLDTNTIKALREKADRHWEGSYWRKLTITMETSLVRKIVMTKVHTAAKTVQMKWMKKNYKQKTATIQRVVPTRDKEQTHFAEKEQLAKKPLRERGKLQRYRVLETIPEWI